MLDSENNVDSCYLCGSTELFLRKGKVRDAPHLKIIECRGCSLVFLYPRAHIGAEHYENSGMHGMQLPSMAQWQKITACDDERRFVKLNSLLPNKKILDFGCGNGGFLLRAKTLAAQVTGVEPERRVGDHFEESLDIVRDLETIQATACSYDLITAFHVVEHLPDPVSILQDLKKLLAHGGRIVVEVPSSEDALLTLYDSDAFQRFTYWSQHLFLFNAHTLSILAARAGLSVVAIEQYQRYPLSNHLHWLSKEAPGGHQIWAFLDSPALHEAYSHSLAKIGKTDTLIAYLE